jgi:hypothetical protein
MRIIIVFLLLVTFSFTSAFVNGPGRIARAAARAREALTELEMAVEEKNAFNSKLLPDFTEEELREMFKEFNITNFRLDEDPDLLKWQPSKEFFEKFGFQNNTLRYARKTEDVKKEFYAAYRKPILPQYKTFVADIMAMTFVQTIDSRFVYDNLYAFGLCTQYYTVMKGYPMSDEIDIIFNAMMKAVGFKPQKIRDDAKSFLTVVKEGSMTEEDLLSATEGPIAEVFNSVRTNRFFKYTDAWGVGLGRVVELIGGEANEESFGRWCESLKWVFTSRLMSTWEEFSADQLRMQGIEAMQKQLMIREKRRAAARLEKKASEFEDKKKAILELNEAIEERRQQLIEEQKELKKKFEPDAYAELVESE